MVAGMTGTGEDVYYRVHSVCLWATPATGDHFFEPAGSGHALAFFWCFIVI